MNTADLDRIEDVLHVELPDRYRNTMLAYPFPPDHEAAAYYMPDNAAVVLKLNADRNPKWPLDLVIIGNDGSEEQFLLDCRSDLAPILVHELETDKIRPLAPDFNAWMAQLEAWQRQVADDQAFMQRRYDQRRWWQFWIGPPNA